jgi:glutaconate CoA-transferase subunit A
MQAMTVRELIAEFVADGASVALEGFTHLIPFAAGHEIIRQRRRDLHLIRMTPDLVYDQMIGMGCARRLTFSWGGNPGVGSLHRLRDAVEHAWPRPLELDEHSHAGMAAGLLRGRGALPFGTAARLLDNDLDKVNPRIRRVDCPFTGETLAAVPALNPDVTILHAQRADRAGNVALHGIVGAQREAAMAAKTLLVTVEEIVDALPPAMNAWSCRTGWSRRSRIARAVRTRPTRTATTRATTPSTSAGTRSRASATASSPGCSARPGHRRPCRLPRQPRGKAA